MIKIQGDRLGAGAILQEPPEFLPLRCFGILPDRGVGFGYTRVLAFANAGIPGCQEFH